MQDRDNSDTVFVGVLLGFLIFFGLLEQQKQQTARLREIRRRLNAQNGKETDAQNLNEDWQNIRGDLSNASQKAIKDLK